jgi:hypothetical protein
VQNYEIDNLVGQCEQKIWIILHEEIAGDLVDEDTSRWNAFAFSLGDVSRNCRKKWLIFDQLTKSRVELLFCRGICAFERHLPPLTYLSLIIPE